jgi:hypothetical protein
MRLEKQPDFERILARFEAWWQCEIIDRPVVSLSVDPEREPILPQKTHRTVRDRWFDFDFRMDCLEASLDVAEFVGDSFPSFWPNLGPSLCATVFGCDLEYSERTAWSAPVAKSIRDVLKIRPDLNNAYWSAIRRATQESIQRGNGKWITGISDLHTNGDLVAALRDPQELCLDCADDLEGVRLACEYVTDFYAPMFEDTWKLIDAAGQPTTTWCRVPHAGKSYVTNCDFICMISPKMFQEAILPSIVREMRYLDCNLFHLDGPNALQHLDALLDLPELNGIQWVYGAGQGPAARWIDIYKRVQAAGKCIQVGCQDFEDARRVAEHLRPEGVWFTLGSFPRTEAEAIVKWVEQWGASKAHKPRRR